MFTLALRGVISGFPFFLSGTLPPKATLADGMPQRFSLWQGGLAEAQFVPRLGEFTTTLRVHLPGAAVGEDPQTEQEPWAYQGLLLVRYPKWESAGVNPTPPSLAFSLCPNLYLLVRVAGWHLSQPAGMQRSSGGAHTYTPPPETQQTLLQWSASYQRQQNSPVLTMLVTTVVVST